MFALHVSARGLVPLARGMSLIHVMEGFVNGLKGVILGAMCTGCDLMGHVKMQLPQASLAALLAGICWTGSAFLTA